MCAQPLLYMGALRRPRSVHNQFIILHFYRDYKRQLSFATRNEKYKKQKENIFPSVFAVNCYASGSLHTSIHSMAFEYL